MPASVPEPPLRISIAAAVNDDAVLANCLARSPDILNGRAALRTYVGYGTAGEAYNAAIDEAQADYIVLAHQDVYLPSNFCEQLASQILLLNIEAPNWAVAGPIGLDEERRLKGMVWSSGLKRIIGERLPTPTPAISLDELLLVVRIPSGIRFDTQLPSFHLFGTDIIYSAAERGFASYVIDAPVIHHSRPVISLKGGYQAAYRYMQKKWRRRLPMDNLICTIRSTGLWLTYRHLQIRKRHRGKMARPEPVGDPAAIAKEVGFESA